MRQLPTSDLRAAYLAVIVVVGLVGLAAPAGAHDASTLDLDAEASQVETGATATYTIDHTLSVGDADDHDHLSRFVFNFDGADTSGVTLGDVAVEVDGERVGVRRVQQGESTLTVDFSPQTYGDSDEHHVRITVENVVNPDAGTYSLSSEPMEDPETKTTEGVPRTSYVVESPETPTPEPTPTETPSPTETGPSDDEAATDTPESMPGFGVVLALVAILGAALVTRRSGA